MNNDTDHINFEIEKFSLDSSVVIAFFNSNLEHILRVVFKNKIYFSSEIFKEIKRYDLGSFNCHIVNTKTVEESEYFYQLSGEHISLSVADVHLITICKFNSLVCVSFEKKMRKVCNEENIKNIGLLHILKAAVKLSLLDNEKARNIVLKLKNNGLYLDKTTINKIFKEFCT
ncbi:hypothetical protein KKG48_03835 [Patescibacteria group bacterium]|nr:hypothetical protein [Patescibacteria group bacterium]MCG2791397.1 hypothetical protein [Actinomycetes bacterium]